MHLVTVWQPLAIAVMAFYFLREKTSTNQMSQLVMACGAAVLLIPQTSGATSLTGVLLLIIGVSLLASGIVATKFLSDIHLAAMPLMVNSVLAVISAVGCAFTGVSLLPILASPVFLNVMIQAGTLIAL